MVSAYMIGGARLLQRKLLARRRPTAKSGWFYDPRREAKYRFWDGARWTRETSDTWRPTRTADDVTET